MSDGWIVARDVTMGTRIVWAGHRCTVTRAERQPRQWHAHRIWMLFDLDVPGLPPRKHVAYSPDEFIRTWEPGQ